jgi:RNA polymerase sigma-70 factor (ECF subfamily)
MLLFGGSIFTARGRTAQRNPLAVKNHGTAGRASVYNLQTHLSGEAQLDEPTLIRRAANGDPAAWEPLMRAHQQAVFRLSYLLLGDPDDAEDIAQETFLRAWNHLQRFDASRPLRPWLLSIASNLASNRRRSAGRYLAALTRAFRNEPKPAPLEEKSAQQMEADHLWQAVQTLSPPDRQIVYLRYFLDLSVAETSAVLQLAEGTVKSRLSRALEKLRRVIQQDFPALSKGFES